MNYRKWFKKNDEITFENLVKRINEYAALIKIRDLTKLEKNEREELRKRYIEIVKTSTENNLKQIKIVPKDNFNN